MRAGPILSISLLAAGCAVAGGAPVQAAIGQVRPVCPATEDPDAYSGPGFLYLRGGRDDWIFRSETDYRNWAPFGGTQSVLLAELVRKLRARGTKLVVLVPPPRGLTMRQYINPNDPRARHFDPRKAELSYRLSLRRAERAGAIVPDVLGMMRLPPGRPGSGPLFYPGDIHWTVLGANRGAAAVRGALLRDRDYRAMAPKAFATQFESPSSVTQGLEEELTKICGGGKAPKRQYALVRTTALEDGGGGLLGESTINFVLAGTSFSRDDSRFPGLLQQHLRADVLNYSVPGGGIDTSMLQYLASVDFAESKPKFLIWEFLYHHIATEEVFRKLLGTLDGDCRGKTLIRTAAWLKMGETRFPRSRLAKLPTQGARVIFDPGKTGLKALDLKLTYTDGRIERIAFDGSRMTQMPRYYGLRLPAGSSGLASVSVIARQRAAGAIGIRLCPAA